MLYKKDTTLDTDFLGIKNNLGEIPGVKVKIPERVLKMNILTQGLWTIPVEAHRRLS